MRASAWGNRRPRGSPLQLIAVLALIAGLAVVAGLLQPHATLEGRAEAVDGDTLRIGSTRIRLLGLDAPELDQTCTDRNGQAWDCGRQARTFVHSALEAGRATCVSTEKDRYGRRLAKCTVGGGDLGTAIVSAGWAVAEPDYAFAALAARAQGRGIWTGSFEQPADWRRDHGAQPGWWDWLQSWLG